MSKRRKKEKHDEHMDESWLLPYSDMLTLLFALFIVLFSASNIDAQKFQAISKVFGDLFTSGTGIVEYPSTVPEGSNQDEEDERAVEQQEDEDEQADEMQHRIELLSIQERINTYIQTNNLTNQLQTSLTDEGLLVTIKDNVLFDSGSATVRREDIEIAREISELLVIDPPRNIIISGHTDNVPISNANFGSNWELSVMRAINFLKILLENDKLDPSYFSAKGFGEFNPIASNDTADGRSKNRRVEVLILPNYAEEE